MLTLTVIAALTILYKRTFSLDLSRLDESLRNTGY